ncbi:MAG: oxidoreductase, partial [Marivirga sp.]|nr:oxidoreductase [Marivirga sp.]
RSAEDAAKFFYSVFGFLIPKKYEAIESAKVAKAMIHFASLDKSGIFIHESTDLQQF